MVNKKLETLIAKIRSINKTATGYLEFNSNKVDLKASELNNFVNDEQIDPVSIRVLATFFQNVSLEKFSLEEWKILLSFDYSPLGNNSPRENPLNTFNILEPTFDLEGSLFNLPTSTYKIQQTHLRSLASYKNRSINFLINYLLEQL